jgi:hypothetical protein
MTPPLRAGQGPQEPPLGSPAGPLALTPEAAAELLWQRLQADRWPVPRTALPADAALVGGAVRDGLLDRLAERPDLDLVVDTDAIADLAVNIGNDGTGQYTDGGGQVHHVNTGIDDFGPGDIWYFPRGHGHMLQCLGNEPCFFILVFDNGYFSEFGTFSVSDWIGHVPPHVLAKNFRVPAATFDAFPKRDVFMAGG